MMIAAFRDWEYKIMEEYLHTQECSPIDRFYKERLSPFFSQHSFYLHTNFVIVYLEDFNKKSDGTYQLLMDFFTFSDYTRFIDEFGHVERGEQVEGNGIPKTTFFMINNYRSNDVPIKGAHYYMDFRALKSLSPDIDEDITEGFPLLYNINLSRNEKTQVDRNNTLLYLTTPMTYPQWLFSSLDTANYPESIANGLPVELLVWDVWQGNYNEVKAGNMPYVIFDAGTEVLETASNFIGYRQKLENELNLSELPMFVLSHWHTDHYSLVFALSDDYLRRIKCYVFPSYVKNLSVFLFVARLNLLGLNVNMVTLPSSSKWVKNIINANLTLYANRYVMSSVNNSGLTLFVQGPINNAMLPGDCRYRLVENQANDAITAPMKDGQIHYLVVPHHGGLAGAVSYRVKNARELEGMVSVGFHNKHSHPNPNVMAKIRSFLYRPVVMTMSKGDIKKRL